MWTVGGWVTWVIWRFAKKLCTRRNTWGGLLSWWSCQSPVAHICSLLNHLNSFYRGMFKLSVNFDAGLLPYSLSYFEFSGHMAHVLTQRHLPHLLTCTVKSFLFMHTHSSPLSLAASLHLCHTNHSCFIKNGCTFSGPTSYFRTLY